MTGPVVIAAGGTGGHMFPALALAAELARRDQRVIVACDRRGSRYLPAGMSARMIRAASPSGSLPSRLRGLSELAVGFAQSLAFLRRRRPAAVAAFGGYAAVPIGLAAQALRIPTLIHEQNAVLG
ncbi:MAG: glycosyltransferase, partial [Geminicoccaceae bacterium]